MKKTSLTIAATLVLSLAGAATSLAAELPTYEVNGLPISPVQASVLGATNAREAQVATSAAILHTPQRKLNATADAAIATGGGH